MIDSAPAHRRICMPRQSRLSRSIAQRVAFITGGASGMGRATCELFADEGAHVAVTDVRGEDAEEVAAGIREAGGSARAWHLDVADPEAISRVVGDCVTTFGGLDILVNNAGIGVGGAVDSEGYDAVWQHAFDVMLTSHQRLVRAALPSLRASDAGRIINIASTEALGATAGTGPYAAAKHGVVGLTRCVALEGAPHGVTCNAISPGWVETDFGRKWMGSIAADEGAGDAEEYMAAQSAATP